MQKILALLNPKFLQKIDRYLLLHYPRLWATKFHYVIFYSLLANICASFLIVLIPFRLGQLWSNSRLVTISFLAEIAVFLFWLNTQSLFSVEQEYGNTHYALGWMEAIIYTICAILIFSPATTMLVTGIYKTAHDLDIKGHNICEGPILLEFYSDDDLSMLQKNEHQYDMNNLQKALNLAEQAVVTGQVKKVTGIEYAIFIPEANLDQSGSSSSLISISSDEAVIVKEGEEIKLVTGKATIQTYTGIWQFQEFLNHPGVNYEYAVYNRDAYQTCQVVKYFVTDVNTYFKSDEFGFGFLALVNLIFTILGVLFTVILKHANWRIVIYSFLYLLISSVLLGIFTVMFGSFLSRYIDASSIQMSFVIATVSLVLLASIESMRLIGAKKYKQFVFVNFVSLPIAIGILVFTIKAVQPGPTLEGMISTLSVFFLIYLLFTPLQKKILIYLMSLPKE